MRLRLIVLAGFVSGLTTAEAAADNRFTLGTEGFYDRYEEPDATVDISSYYGSITGSYEHTNAGFFSAIDGRYSNGKEDYKSDSGTLSGESAMESDLRLRAGFDLQMWHGHVMPYIGAGWRYYFDEGKGLQTTSSPPAVAYDRHISQFYIPIGTTYRFTSGSWTFSPNAEFDILAFGEVNTHLAPVNVDQNITNYQHIGSSVGLRGEFMAGQQYQHFGWEAGPFFRYWNIADSDCVTTAVSSPGCRYEPHNTRLQAGAAARINF